MPRLALALISLAGLALSGCQPSAEKNTAGGAGKGGMPPPEVSVVTLAPKDIAFSFEYAGQTAGYRETEVRARVNGILEQRLFEEGSKVKAGTILFQIDPVPYQTQLNAAEAAAGVAEAKYNQTKRELARLAPLVAEKAISQKEFDDSRSAFESAEASLKQARAQVNEAKLNLSYTRVVAPIDGVTGVAAKANGSLVSASDNLLTTLVQTDPMYVNFSLPEADYLRITQAQQQGQVSIPSNNSKGNAGLGFEIDIKLADGSLYPGQGKLTFVSAKVNPNNGGFDARAQLANSENRLRPGQFVRVILRGAARKQALAIPQRAVIDGPMGKMVFIVDQDNKLAPRPVKLDGWGNGEWVVTQGLQAGDRVMVEGVIKAHNPGMVVKPVDFDPNAPAKGPGAEANKAPAAPKKPE
ncbi:efflux RND transporter periplasmic adaptor subunit [Parvibium lacunae]|nr:efflux RND transporter periplasmic adaptor subunit [Parvibium lacunae]